MSWVHSYNVERGFYPHRLFFAANPNVFDLSNVHQLEEINSYFREVTQWCAKTFGGGHGGYKWYIGSHALYFREESQVHCFLLRWS